jgi:hypothetical protein
MSRTSEHFFSTAADWTLMTRELLAMCRIAHTHGNVRVDLERSSRCFGRNEELDVVTRTRALNVRVGLVRSCCGGEVMMSSTSAAYRWSS